MRDGNILFCQPGGPGPDGAGAVRAQTVTVAVAPEDANRLSLVSELGSFYLALRNPGDDTVVETPDIRIVDLSPSLKPPEANHVAAPVPQPRPRSQGRVVTVISGGEVNRVTVGQ
jgi:hypothetical protein